MWKRTVMLLLVLSIGLVGTYLYLGLMEGQEVKLDSLVNKYSPSSSMAGLIANETGVENVSDIRYSQNDKNIKLYFGDINLTLGKEELRNPNIQRGLAQLELSYSFTKSGAIILKWRGERVGEIKE